MIQKVLDGMDRIYFMNFAKCIMVLVATKIYAVVICLKSAISGKHANVYVD